MRNQVGRPLVRGQDPEAKPRWSWLVSRRAQDPDVISLVEYRRRKGERVVVAPVETGGVA